MLMIYREDLVKIKVEREKHQKTILDDPFWGRHLPKPNHRNVGLHNFNLTFTKK
jgi:hypothetical protein